MQNNLLLGRHKYLKDEQNKAVPWLAYSRFMLSSS